ncbi:MAG: diguanylate cyclase [Candidatus Accumulibacter sp.]|nr:diguanylate cyclase [Accumulibacter sp.]
MERESDFAQERPRILIVDDSRSVRTTFIKLIREHYAFREEIDGEAGWQALVLDHSIQLVICAISMPILDGDGLLARVRSSRLARLRQMPVLMISSDNEEANEHARTMGASDFISRGIGSSELLARIASLLRLARAQNELRDSADGALRDPETGLPNRQHVEVQAAQALSLAMRQGTPVSILIMSFDHAEELRLRHGDEMSKELLKRFASIMNKTVRKEDSLGHYGGNQLAVVSPGTPYPACESFATRLREAFAVATIAIHGQRLELSLSIGVANTPQDQVSSSTALLELAAERLKKAQQAGGNRVVSCRSPASSEPPRPRFNHALDLIKIGQISQVVPHLVPLGKEVLPFLELLERELKLGLPLANIRKQLFDREAQSKETRQA